MWVFSYTLGMVPFITNFSILTLFFRQEQKIEHFPANTNLEHLCNLNISEPPHSVRKTGIICTIGKFY